MFDLYYNEKQLSDRIIKYHNETKPKIGWEGEKKINHFQLIEKLLINNDLSSEGAQKIVSTENLLKANWIIETEFSELISKERKTIILRYLRYRFGAINDLIKSYDVKETHK